MLEIKKIFKHSWFGFVPLSLFVLLYRLPFLYVPLDRDEGGYAYLGWLWLSGKVIPYLQSYDTKFPPVFLLYGSTTIFGNNFINIRIFFIIYFFILFSICYLLSRKVASNLAAILSTFLLVVYLSTLRLEGGSFNTEIMYLLPLMGYVYLIWKIKNEQKVNYILVIFLGILASVATLFKPVAILPAGGMFLWLLYYQRKIQIILGFIFGFLLPIILLLGYFYQHQALPSLIENLVFYNQGYNKAGFQTLTLFPENKIGNVTVINWLRAMPWVIQPFFFLSIIILLKYRTKKTFLWWAGLITLISSWVGAKIGGTREYPHYYLPLVLGMMFCSLLLFNHMIKQKRTILPIILTLFLSGFVVLPEIRDLTGGPLAVLKGEFGTEGYWAYDASRVSNWILYNTKSTDSFLVWANEPEIYFYTKRQSSSQHINFYSFFYRPPSVKENWLKSIKDSPPDWIVTYGPPVPDPPSYNELVQLFPDMSGYKQQNIDVGSYLVFHKIQ